MREDRQNLDERGETGGEDKRERAEVKQNRAVWVGDLVFGFSLLAFLPLLKEVPRGCAWQQTTSGAAEITWLHLSVRCLHSNRGGVRVDQRGCPVRGGGRGRLQAEPVRSDGAECGLWGGAVQHRWVTTATIVFYIIYSKEHIISYQQLTKRNSRACLSLGFDNFFMVLSQFAQLPEWIETFHSSGSTKMCPTLKDTAERVCDFHKPNPSGKPNHVPKLWISCQFCYALGKTGDVPDSSSPRWPMYAFNTSFSQPMLAKISDNMRRVTCLQWQQLQGESNA